MKQCDVVSDIMAAYRNLYNTLKSEFDGCELTHIGRSSNEEADALANIGLTCMPLPPIVFLEQIYQRSIKVPHPRAAPVNAEATDSTKPTEEADETHALEEVLLVELAWTSPYLAYILQKDLPKNEVEARQLQHHAKAYTLINGDLYKRSYIAQHTQRNLWPPCQQSSPGHQGVQGWILLAHNYARRQNPHQAVRGL
jgi:hypothetical protein